MNIYEKYGSYGVDAEQQVFNDYLLELGLNTCRFIDIESDEKYPVTEVRQYHGNISGNYGIMAGDGLVIVKIEDYEVADEIGALDVLPETFTVESPHGGESRFYHVEGSVSNAVEEATGNPDFAVLSWGQVWVDNLYAMGPGSQLDAGYYEVSHAPELAITTISTETLVQAVLAESDSNDIDPIKFLV